MYPIFVEDENGLDDFWLKARSSSASGATMFLDGNFGIGTTSPNAKLDVAGQVLWGTSSTGGYSGNPRAAVIGYSGGNYGNIGYGWVPTSTSGNYTSAIADLQSRVMLYDGIVVYGSGSAVSVGSTVPFQELLDARTSRFTYKGNNIWHAGNLSKSLTYTLLGSINLTTGTDTLNISPSNGLNSIIVLEVEALSNISPATWTGPLDAVGTSSTYKSSIWNASTKYTDYYRNSAGTQIYFSATTSNNIYRARVYELKVA